MTGTLTLFVAKIWSVKCLSSSVADFSSVGGLCAQTKAAIKHHATIITPSLQPSEAIHNASYGCQRSPLISAAIPFSSETLIGLTGEEEGKQEKKQKLVYPP